MDLECCQQNKTCHFSFVFALCSLSKWLKAFYSKKNVENVKRWNQKWWKNYESKKEKRTQKDSNIRLSWKNWFGVVLKKTVYRSSPKKNWLEKLFWK